MHRGPSGDGRGGRGRVHARARRGRPFPALQSVVAALLDTGLWLLALPLAAVAIALAFVGGARILPAYAAVVLYGLSAAGFVWVLWSFTELELPYEQDEGVVLLVRLCGSLVVVSVGLVPSCSTLRGTAPTPRPFTCGPASIGRLQPSVE